jgi:carboxyl-terminal processing protease
MARTPPIRTLILSCFLLCVPVVAKAPELEARDVRMKLKEILRSHARHKELDTVIAGRTLVNFVDSLDPGKTYFTEHEVAEWVEPSEELKLEVLEGYRSADFATFEKIHDQMMAAIERRNQIEEKIRDAELPTDVVASEFIDTEWAKSETELEGRLLRLRALQLQIASKVGSDDQELMKQRLEKRRMRNEERFLGTTQLEQHRLMLAHVLRSTASALDSHTSYFTPEEASDFMIQLQQRLFGIGVQLRDTLDGFSVVRVIEGGPAFHEGSLKADDLIIAVNGEYVGGLDILDVVQMIRGKSGTPVTLSLLRDDTDKFDVELMRDEVVLKETRFESEVEPSGDGVIGRLALHSFYQDARYSSTSDLRGAIEELKSNNNLKGLILDLRYNSGGLLPQAIGVTGLFIKKGVVASIKDNQGRVQHLRNTDEDVAWDGPLIVLVSRGSASASEIVAGSLQDFGRALIVGDPTSFGKGTFQTSTLDAVHGKHVNPKGEFKVTRGAYYTTSGKTPQLTGVVSDVVAPGPLAELDIGERYAKYPLEPDSIPPSFEDDLSDIPFIHRAQARRAYLFDLQQPTTMYTRHIPILRAKSKGRIDANGEYQEFLNTKAEPTAERDPDQTDFQMVECVNIMKDLILLQERSQ